MTEEPKLAPKDADILDRISAEKFRRRLLIASRVIALALVLALAWWGWIYLQYGKMVATDPCYACGYYGGKRCEPVFFEGGVKPVGEAEEAYRKQLGDYNKNYNYSLYYDRFQQKMFDQTNYTDLFKNFTVTNVNESQ